jgi:hypothetical protein
MSAQAKFDFNILDIAADRQIHLATAERRADSLDPPR